jgi:hypothetical protein
MFSDTFAGIAPASVPAFVAAQLVGGALAYLLVRVLLPRCRGRDLTRRDVRLSADPRTVVLDRPNRGSPPGRGGPP